MYNSECLQPPAPCWQRRAIRPGRTLQAEIYLAFGIVFANLALPLALYDLGLHNWGERLLSLIWALEGASLVWLGRRNGMRLFRIFGMFSLTLGFIYVLRYVSHGLPVYMAGPADALPPERRHVYGSWHQPAVASVRRRCLHHGGVGRASLPCGG